jgi:hypothetical protein
MMKNPFHNPRQLIVIGIVVVGPRLVEDEDENKDDDEEEYGHIQSGIDG